MCHSKIIAAICGEGRNLLEYAMFLVCGGHIQDLRGIKYMVEPYKGKSGVRRAVVLLVPWLGYVQQQSSVGPAAWD